MVTKAAQALKLRRPIKEQTSRCPPAHDWSQLDAQVRRIKSEPGTVHAIPSPMTQNSPAPCGSMEQTKKRPRRGVGAAPGPLYPSALDDPKLRGQSGIPNAHT